MAKKSKEDADGCDCSDHWRYISGDDCATQPSAFLRACKEAHSLLQHMGSACDAAQMGETGAPRSGWPVREVRETGAPQPGWPVREVQWMHGLFTRAWVSCSLHLAVMAGARDRCSTIWLACKRDSEDARIVSSTTLVTVAIPSIKAFGVCAPAPAFESALQDVGCLAYTRTHCAPSINCISPRSL
eukprot:scaffold38326_cov20-Tisochrysis_lutea.AAC.2